MRLISISPPSLKVPDWAASTVVMGEFNRAWPGFDPLAKIDRIC
jgi:hypothetical protein